MKQLTQHIEFEKLVGLAESNMTANELQNMDEHLSECSHCVGLLQKLENFISYSQQQTYEAVPQPTTANLLNIFQPSKPIIKQTFTERLRGILTFDDWLPEFAVNERLAFSDTRQMLFRAADYEIDLRLNFAAGRCQINGQIFPDCAGAKVEISSENFADKVSHKVLLNEYCEFVFPFVAEGIYDFKIILKDKEIEIPQIAFVS